MKSLSVLAGLTSTVALVSCGSSYTESSEITNTQTHEPLIEKVEEKPKIQEPSYVADTKPLTSMALDLSSAKRIKENCETTTDDFKKEISIRTPLIITRNNQPTDFYLLRATLRNNKLVSCQLYVSFCTDDRGWKIEEFYRINEIIDKDSRDLDFVIIDRSRDEHKWMTEVFAINLSEDFLKSLFKSGLIFKAYGSRDTSSVKNYSIPSYFFKGFHEAIMETKKR